MAAFDPGVCHPTGDELDCRFVQCLESAKETLERKIRFSHRRFVKSRAGWQEPDQSESNRADLGTDIAGAKREYRSAGGRNWRSPRPVSHTGTFEVKSFRRRFHRRERVILRKADRPGAARHDSAELADLFQSRPPRSIQRSSAHGDASDDCFHWRNTVSANCSAHRDSDQTRIARSGPLQTRAGRQTGPPLHAHEVSIHARERRERWTRVGQVRRRSHDASWAHHPQNSHRRNSAVLEHPAW